MLYVSKLLLKCFLVIFFKDVFSQIDYNKYFTSSRLRIEYTLTGNKDTTIVTINDWYKEDHWSGPYKNLVDTLLWGNYYIQIFDSIENRLIYSRGFSNLFYEWKFSSEAKNTTKSFSQFFCIPYPRSTVFIKFFERNYNQSLVLLKSQYINPNYSKIAIPIKDKFYFPYQVKNTTNKAIDIVIISEGYTRSDSLKFFEDAKNMTEKLLKMNSLKKFSSKINIGFVFQSSNEKGASLQDGKTFKNTNLKSYFYALGVERYIAIDDYNYIGRLLSNIDYDYFIVLVNTLKYCGAGIFNYYSIVPSDALFKDYILYHEFGHQFAGLADEYEEADEYTQNFYNLNAEPWEYNITTLVQFSKKWKKYMKKTKNGTYYYNKKLNVGLYKGAGYRSEKIYRSSLLCIMRSFETLDFCFVCSEAFKLMLNLNIDK
ncbi:MAG: IgA Peptidase M64 [Bacteroidales bacterium]|nr:IgA Peptidase M64 [Bacteroidales bacterium]